MTAATAEKESAPVVIEPGSTTVEEADGKPRFDWARITVYGLLPGLALLLAMGAGFLKWQYATLADDTSAQVESVQAAKDSTIAMLSYQPGTVDRQLGAARDLLTGDFRNSYTQLTTDVVIPGAKQKQISAVATVPAAALVNASENHSIVMVYVNQTTTVGKDAPTQSISSIRVTLDKVDGHWLVSQFEPM